MYPRPDSRVLVECYVYYHVQLLPPCLPVQASLLPNPHLFPCHSLGVRYPQVLPWCELKRQSWAVLAGDSLGFGALKCRKGEKQPVSLELPGGLGLQSLGFLGRSRGLPREKIFYKAVCCAWILNARCVRTLGVPKQHFQTPGSAKKMCRHLLWLCDGSHRENTRRLLNVNILMPK